MKKTAQDQSLEPAVSPKMFAKNNAKMKYIRHYAVLALFAFTIAKLNADSPASPSVPPSNCVLKITGNFLDLKPLDITMIGSGPDFTVVLAEPTGRIHAFVLPLAGGKFSIQYDVGFPIAIKTENNVTYKDAQVTGKVIIAAGRPIPVVKIGDHTLIFSVSDFKE